MVLLFFDLQTRINHPFSTHGSEIGKQLAQYELATVKPQAMQIHHMDSFSIQSNEKLMGFS